MSSSSIQEHYPFFLQHLQRHIRLSDDEKMHVCSLLKLRRVLPRQFLLNAGDICKFESFVVKGFLRSFYLDDQGNDFTLHFAMEDWWIADFASFRENSPATRNIVALEQSIVLQLDKEAIESLYRDIPQFEHYRRVLSENVSVTQDERLIKAISMSGAERYEALIQKYPNIEQRLPQKHIASYLGITPVFLSKIRAGKNA